MNNVTIDRVVNRVQAVGDAGGLSAETLQAIVDAVLPAVEDMLAHRQRVHSERSTNNGYLDWIEHEGDGGQQ